MVDEVPTAFVIMKSKALRGKRQESRKSVFAVYTKPLKY